MFKPEEIQGNDQTSTHSQDIMSSNDMQISLLSLPPITRRFFVPPLSDKPQNPIMDTVKSLQEKENGSSVLFKLPPELGSFVADPYLAPRSQQRNRLADDFWRDALTRNLGIRSKTLSWDKLRPSHSIAAASTAFLSEQDDLVFAAARYHVNLRLRDPMIDMIYVTQSNILHALKMTVLGTSSVYHVWDTKSERFKVAGVDEGKTGNILIDGKDEVVTQRRLETFLTSLRARSVQDGPTVHAYAHVLATIIAHLRRTLASCPPANDPLFVHGTLSAIWMRYSVYEETLVALAELYGRVGHLSSLFWYHNSIEYQCEHTTPDKYPDFDPSPTRLLSSIYNHLERHITRQSPSTIIAIFAFMLTHVSRDYLQQISLSVGYGTDQVKKASRARRDEAINKDAFDDDEEEPEDDIYDILDRVGDSFPDFFPKHMLNILPAAQKSLILLERAQPDHPMLQRKVKAPIQWFWTESLVQAACAGQYPGNVTDHIVLSRETPSPLELPSDSGLSLFRIFDLEPGVGVTSSSALSEAQSMPQYLETFINSFPSTLPSITPTLTHLTSVVLAPLVEHASALSTALLDLFLDPSPTTQDTLNFKTHLVLLRSYLLLTSPPFKARLSAALFSDKEAGEVDNKAHGLAIRSLRQRSSSNKKTTSDQNTPEPPWAIGLSPNLLERKTWPPVGADLSFFLRTVIVDSIDDTDGWNDNLRDVDGAEKVRSRVLEEAEYRLGFAIRDLPTGTGKHKWLNPLSIEALDFLYMDYRPPPALQVLITPDILSKYQRMFALLLRIARVEHALKSLFRMTQDTKKPLFSTLTPSRKALLHLRFVAQSFVSNLSAYIFDTAISGNIDPFLVRLATHGKDADISDANTRFPDVFVLAKEHSALLDDILTACLLRSGQRAVAEVLRSALESILEFTTVMGQLYRERIPEYEAATQLEDISKKFFARMTTLIKVLRGLVEKNGLSESTMLLQSSLCGVDTARKPTGGTEALSHLLIRLDLGVWWTMSRQ
ncbi:hypothetical protein H0H93_013309 [Arthromyces matolae]|nr:hypothetical protein H0H93_013309 [Arthromyces matolae]